MKNLILSIGLLILVACSSEQALHPILPLPLQAGDQADIMYVIDTSGSMKDDSYTQYGLVNTMEEFNELDVDWQLAITTADASDQEWIEIPTTDEPGWDVVLGIDYIQDQTWSYREQGLASSLKKMEDHRNWFRPGATSIIVIASDEDEQSDLDPTTIHDLWPEDLIIVAIVGPNDTSRPAGCSATIAPIYHQALDIHIDICQQSPWSIVDELKKLGI